MPFANEAAEPDMNPIDSSGIGAIGYEPNLQTLYVHFLSGAKYKFFDVSPEKYKLFSNEKNSHGQHFMKHVRGQYKFERYD